ncbi:unnamed protein product [Triticum turgidum subsp. durum]|uniref:PRA1 family protein n=2 Tax=Triticum TaxID=4564 RepID=A0A9R0THV0_TRITD|nr:unnamed protein product [Triticum turgidum subsp. durum]
MLFLMAASKGLLLYGALLRAFPASALLRRLLDRRLVAAVFVALVLADLAAAGALPNLLFALAAGAPVVLLHAAFRVRDDLEPGAAASADNGAGGEEEEATGVVVEKKEDGDMETGPTRRSATAAAKS